MSYCKNCGLEIEWLQAPDGRYIPVEPKPVFVIEADGRDKFYTDEGRVFFGRAARPDEVQTREQKDNTPVGFVPHWAKCGRAARLRYGW